MDDLLDEMTGKAAPEPDKTEQKSLAIAETGDMTVGGYTLTSRGLVVGQGATLEDWEQIGALLLRLEGSIQLLIGDWLVEAEREYNQTYQEIAESTGYSVKHLYNCKWVAENIDFSLRKEKLTFTHYMAVAALPDDQKREMLERASAEGWSVKQLKEALRPTLSESAPVQLSFDFANNSKKMRKIERRAIKAGQGDDRARLESLGWIAELRSQLDELEEALGGD
jgi:hypothetical protein